MVDSTSAVAGLVTPFRPEPCAQHTPVCLTVSQHKCVGFTLFDSLDVLHCSGFLILRILSCTRPRAAPIEGRAAVPQHIAATQELTWTHHPPRVQCTVPAGGESSTALLTRSAIRRSSACATCRKRTAP